MYKIPSTPLPLAVGDGDHNLIKTCLKGPQASTPFRAITAGRRLFSRFAQRNHMTERLTDTSRYVDFVIALLF